MSKSEYPFIAWFREVAPYIHSFRGKTFVIAFGGKAVQEAFARSLAWDVAMLTALGVRLVLVHGARPQIEEELRETGIESHFHGNYRITDAKTLDCVIDAAGSVSLEIEALLSQGLPNTPMAGATIRVVGGNFITAKPMGVLDGVDLHYTGAVRKVDTEGIKAQLSLGNIALLSCVGVSPTGENFNLNMEDVAEAVALAMLADKLIYITDRPGVTDAQGALLEELTASDAETLMKEETWLSADLRRCLPACIRATRRGVGRVHIVGYQEDGALLEELFTRDGVGTIITKNALDILRDARGDDIGGLVALIEPMEEEGILVRRSRELLEREIGQFSVVEHDGMIVGCAAMYPYGTGQAELACVAVHNDFRRYGYGDQLVKLVEQRARASGVKQLFVLTTRTAHWFIERGFAPASIDELPDEKRLVYNFQRNSKVFIKKL